MSTSLRITTWISCPTRRLDLLQLSESNIFVTDTLHSKMRVLNHCIKSMWIAMVGQSGVFGHNPYLTSVTINSSHRHPSRVTACCLPINEYYKNTLIIQY